MRIEREGLGDVPLAHRDERHGVDQTQPPRAALGQQVETGVVQRVVDADHLDERRKVRPKAPDGVETEPSAAVQPARPRPAEPPVGAVVAEMAGMILTFRLGIGDAVSEGDVICVVEAMKMMREVRSPHTGVVREIHVGDGETIDAGDLLAVIAADAP